MENTNKWVQDVCNALNEVDFKMPREKGEWHPSKFEHPIELIKEHITYDRGIYNFLNEKGLLNRGFCPITGESINDTLYYELFGRRIFFSQAGLESAKEHDRQSYIKRHGKEPMSEERKQEIRNTIIAKESNKGCFYFIGVIFLCVLLFKMCF